MSDDGTEQRLEQLIQSPHLADALESARFRRFLDKVPMAIAVAELRDPERIVYVNVEFERLIGRAPAEIEGRSWDALPGTCADASKAGRLSSAIVNGDDYLGSFIDVLTESSRPVDAWSNVIESDDGVPMFRLVALSPTNADRNDLEQRIREKDTLLRELQHRVKNNLQMITTLIRLEGRHVRHDQEGERFDRLAGRVQALALLYHSLAGEPHEESVDLGVYLSQIASAVMGAHAPAGVRLDLKVDTWPCSINVAMPAGLVVNELMTNALKHAFSGREGGKITVHSLADEEGCKVIVADDGNGLAPDARWPQPGKLSSLIVQSLRDNAKARIEVESTPGNGMRVTVFFKRANATTS